MASFRYTVVFESWIPRQKYSSRIQASEMKCLDIQHDGNERAEYGSRSRQELQIFPLKISKYIINCLRHIGRMKDDRQNAPESIVSQTNGEETLQDRGKGGLKLTIGQLKF